jgi:hypothetical protein
VTVERTGDIPGRQLSADLAHGLDLLSHGLELPVHLPAEPLERLTLVPYRFRLSICLLEGGRLLLDPVEEVGRKSASICLRMVENCALRCARASSSTPYVGMRRGRRTGTAEPSTSVTGVKRSDYATTRRRG